MAITKKARPLAGIKVMHSTPHEACIYAGL